MSIHRCWVYADNVNTDVIFPGKYTYTLKTPEDIAAHALEDLDANFAKGVQSGDVIVAGSNWGMGSSREQGVTAIKYNNVNIIIATSFSGLYFRNCINQGVLPIVCAGVNAAVKTGEIVEIDLPNATIVAGGKTFMFPRLSPSVQAIMDAGGLLPMLQTRFQSQSGG
jgi:3-isopropylmalate/(R)-2-methylmalate dehydratase small subunit